MEAKSLIAEITAAAEPPPMPEPITVTEWAKKRKPQPSAAQQEIKK